jgi:hypothetical protein
VSLKLPSAPGQYERDDQARMRGAIERADAQTLKRGVAVSYILLSKPDGTVGKLTVNGSGALTWTAI